MIDIHSHIINNVDDGAKNLDMALNMLRKSEEIGIKGIVATPHYLRGIYNFEYSEIEECAEQLRIEAKKNNINIEIYTGQEVYYTEKIVEYFTEGIIGTINKSRYMLIEFPMRGFDIDAILNDIYELQIRGIVPIIAHPERYKVFLKKPWLINNFIEEGFLFQVNAGSLTGYFGKDVKKLAMKYLENGVYSFIGSDAHRDESRSTDMTEAFDLIDSIDKKYKDDFKRNSNLLVEDGEIEFSGKLIKERKKLLGIW